MWSCSSSLTICQPPVYLERCCIKGVSSEKHNAKTPCCFLNPYLLEWELNVLGYLVSQAKPFLVHGIFLVSSFFWIAILATLLHVSSTPLQSDVLQKSARYLSATRCVLCFSFRSFFRIWRLKLELQLFLLLFNIVPVDHAEILTKSFLKICTHCSYLYNSHSCKLRYRLNKNALVQRSFFVLWNILQLHWQSF